MAYSRLTPTWESISSGRDGRGDAPGTGCQHYKRKCRLVSPCCNRVFPCRFCHDEVENDCKFNRFNVEYIVCNECSTKQRVGRDCIECGVTFGGAYFCVICRLYDDEDKKQFHCEDCGICRVGGRQNYFHCLKCGLCLDLFLRGNHKCIENASRTSCPLCLLDLHTSREPCIVPPCGHLLHKECYEKLLKNKREECVLCEANIKRN